MSDTQAITSHYGPMGQIVAAVMPDTEAFKLCKNCGMPIRYGRMRGLGWVFSDLVHFDSSLYCAPYWTGEPLNQLRASLLPETEPEEHPEDCQCDDCRDKAERAYEDEHAEEI